MHSISDEIIQKLKTLNLININLNLSEKIVSIAINSIQNYINCEINPFIDFSLIKQIFIDLVIGEYLLLIKNANLDSTMDFEPAIKSISEGDVSITYSTENLENNAQKLNFLIDYFLSKKSLLLNFKSIRWWYYF